MSRARKDGEHTDVLLFHQDIILIMLISPDIGDFDDAMIMMVMMINLYVFYVVRYQEGHSARCGEASGLRSSCTRSKLIARPIATGLLSQLPWKCTRSSMRRRTLPQP
jgi:hypothetical protein